MINNNQLLYVVIGAGGTSNVAGLERTLGNVGQVLAYPEGGTGFYVMLNAGKTHADLRSALTSQESIEDIAIQVVDQNTSIFPASVNTWLTRISKAA